MELGAATLLLVVPTAGTVVLVVGPGGAAEKIRTCKTLSVFKFLHCSTD